MLTPDADHRSARRSLDRRAEPQLVALAVEKAAHVKIAVGPDLVGDGDPAGAQRLQGNRAYGVSRGWGTEEEARPVIIVEGSTEFATADTVARGAVGGRTASVARRRPTDGCWRDEFGTGGRTG